MDEHQVRWTPGANRENKSGSLSFELICCIPGGSNSEVIHIMETPGLH